MYNVKDFEGEVAKHLNYELMSIGDMVSELLKEIVFHGCGFGWTTASDEIEEVHIMYHYTEKTHGLTSSGYIANLKIMLGAEIHYLTRTEKIFKPIKGFKWNIVNTDDEDFFVLVLRKM